MPNSKHAYWILLLVLAATIAVYANGLGGPFLFDDYVHITKNQWVKIESLAWPDLVQAWNSSFSNFPSNRPLAQLSFGINHALSGLDPWAFKATNLAIHLTTGLMVFVFTRLAYQAVNHGKEDASERGTLLALATTVLWLLHPINVSTVLYTVQRMAQLSSLALLVALSCYIRGRIRIADGRSGIGWMLASAPIAIVGFLAKENTILLPLLLLATELTLLQGVSISPRRGAIRLIWAVFIALPLIAGIIYFVTHPGLLYYELRPFTLEERVLTQPRVLFSYLHWLLIPDISAFGLFHDDIQISDSLVNPPSTLIAIIAWFGLILAALVLRRKAPVFAFAVLFFLAGHALESSVLPLEMAFEHRNYLVIVGPLMLLAHLVTVSSEKHRVRSLALSIGVLLLLSYTVVTYLRVNNWTSYNSFILSAADNHPNSARSNFQAAQLMITVLGKSKDRPQEIVDLAEYYLHQGLSVDTRCINCLFGMIVLDLHLGKAPDPGVISRLTDALRQGYVGPTKVSLNQFSYLVKWKKSGSSSLSSADLEAIFDAALANRSWVPTGEASIRSAYREYYEFVVGDLETALLHARAAVKAWPQPWNYRMQLVRVLEKLGRYQEALGELDSAADRAKNEKQKRETAETASRIEHQLQH